MATWNYVMNGVVHPERAMLECGAFPTAHMTHEAAQLDVEVSLSIFKNQITLGLTSASRIENLDMLRNVMTEAVSDIVNCAALDVVVAYQVELRSVYNVSEGNTLVFGPNVPGLSIGDKEHRTADVTASIEVTRREPYVRRALADFTRAIRYPADTGFFCYRAVECLINLVMERDGIADKKRAIGDVDRTLNLDPACIEFLRVRGGEVRHGRFPWISGEDRVRALKTTREILQRFIALDFSRSTSQPVPAFPLLQL